MRHVHLYPYLIEVSVDPADIERLERMSLDLDTFRITKVDRSAPDRWRVVVACAFPPDTRTPGLDRENELKPEETARISAAISPRDADTVARASWRASAASSPAARAAFSSASARRKT